MSYIYIYDISNLRVKRLPLKVRAIYALFIKVLITQDKLAPFLEKIEETETFDTTADIKHINVHDFLPYLNLFS
jgi:hypothetical protein